MALVKKENISVAYEKYTNKAGEEKTSWHTIGEVLTFQREDGSYSKMVKMYNMPGVSISLFEQKEREGATAKKPAVPTIQQDDRPTSITPEEEINLKDIPF